MGLQTHHGIKRNYPFPAYGDYPAVVKYKPGMVINPKQRVVFPVGESVIRGNIISNSSSSKYNPIEISTEAIVINNCVTSKYVK